MAIIIEYIKYKWKKRFATTAEEKFPAKDDHQKAYRKDFYNIVDQYLIYQDKDDNGFKEIVYIDSENDIDWLIEGDNVTEKDKTERNKYIAKLDIVHALSIQNLSHEEIINFKKMLGVGYCAALHCNWEEVDMAIENATKYRNDRNKERSRFLLLKAATIYLFLLIGTFLFFIHFLPTHPHLNVFGGIFMGTMGSYVSIWTRYGKMDITGLGTPRIHYLEAFARMLIGAIFATVIILVLKSGIVLNDILLSTSQKLVYALIGFCAGFSEKFVPSVMEHLIKEQTNQ